LNGGKDNCTHVRRAYNAIKAGASGVLITEQAGKEYKGLTMRVNADKDDLPSIQAIDVPVGALWIEQGVPPSVLSWCC
jgi:hypothetical protein